MLCSWQQRAEDEHYSRKSAAERRLEAAAAWEAEKAEAKKAKVGQCGLPMHEKPTSKPSTGHWLLSCGSSTWPHIRRASHVHDGMYAAMPGAL
jgi:hypothetical protein